MNKYLILLLGILLSVPTQAQIYCDKSLPKINSSFYVSKFELNEMVQSSGASGYSDYSSKVAYLAIGKKYKAKISYLHNRQDFYIYLHFDWDNDGVFDYSVGKKVKHRRDSQTEAVLELGFRVPANAKIGETRVRLVYAYDRSDIKACDVNRVSRRVGEVEDYTISIAPSSSFPIDLLFFEAYTIESAVELKWTTASEENNDYFTIERSQDGELWEFVTQTQGAGNSNYNIDYQYIDNQSLSGLFYYRLKQTDYDGAYTYSEIVAVKRNEMKEISMRVSPNPAINRIVLDVEYASIQEIEIYNMMGQIVSSNVRITANGSDSYSLDISSLPIGVYIISTNKGSVKFYKQ